MIFIMKGKPEKKEYPLWVRIILPVIFWLALWSILSAAIGQEILLPSPAAVCRRLIELAGTTGFWAAAGLSLVRIFLGAAAGTAAGMFLAWLTFFSHPMDTIISPAIRILRATPVASFIILVLLWIKTGAVPGVISGLMVMPVIWQSVRSGFENTDPGMLEFAKAYGFGRFKTLKEVYIPSISPYFVSGLCTAAGFAWKSGVAAEVLCLPKTAIGTQVYYSKIYLETPSLFAWTAVVVVMSIVLEKLIKSLLRKRRPE